MATPLAIGYLALPRRNPQATGAHAPRAAFGALSDRPPIPRGVITWPDLELPVGARDPAVAIDGPPPFAMVRERARRGSIRDRIETALFGAVLVAFFGVASLAAIGVAQAVVGAELSPAATAALSGRVPVVETRLLSIDMAAPAAARAASTMPATTATGG